MRSTVEFGGWTVILPLDVINVRHVLIYVLVMFEGWMDVCYRWKYSITEERWVTRVSINSKTAGMLKRRVEIRHL
jgi:hypothetical protein